MNNSVINKISIVLVATTHPGNIGATARAMKTMGIQSLRLVTPKIFPSAEATARATGADDILASAEIFASLKEAINDCSLVFATSARSRNISWPTSTPVEAAEQIVRHAQTGAHAAIVFGRESSGMTNEEIDCCNAMVQIPSNPGFSSLNLASAVQILCYEIHKCLSGHESDSDLAERSLATTEQMQLFYEHLEAVLVEIDYLDPATPRKLMRRLKRLFNRSQLDSNEYNILRGILAAIQENSSRPKV